MEADATWFLQGPAAGAREPFTGSMAMDPLRCQLVACLVLALYGTAPAQAQGRIPPQGPVALHVGNSGAGLSYSLPLATPGLGAPLGQPDVTGRGRMGWTDLSVMGDYYILGTGFRATGGLMVHRQRHGDPTLATGGGRIDLDPRLGAGTLPYLGLGYSGSVLRPQASPWGFFADVGLVMLKPRASVRLGPTSAGSWLGSPRPGALDADGGRDWRVSPVIQMGVSYSF